MTSLIKSLALSSSLVFSAVTLADTFSLSSADISAGKPMSKTQEFEGFGCEGGNTSPQLSWTGAPEGTEAYALMVHDADAPTGGAGFWHWQILNIPATATSLPAGAGSADSKLLPTGTEQRKNDYGLKGFGGACPPEGHGPHHYRFTLYALPQKLDIPSEASSAVVGFMVVGNALASTTLEATYER